MALPRASPPNPRVLLVEGQDDKHVIANLRKRHQFTPDFDILAKDGLDTLLETVGAELNVPGRQAIGILIDANDDLTARWNAVKDKLPDQYRDSLSSLDPNGTIIQVKPRIGIWLMPDNTHAGEIEDFVIKMIPEGDPVWSLSERDITGIPETERKFSEVRHNEPNCMRGSQPGRTPGKWV